MRNYIDLRSIYDVENKFGDFNICINEKNIIATDVIRDFYKLSNSLQKDYTFVLKKISTDEIIMTDDEIELLSNKWFLDNASGDILILGLGFGLIVFPLLKDDTIKSITIIEREQDIIDYVGDKIKNLDIKNKVQIKNGNAYDYHKNESEHGKYDYVYIDFWHKLDKSAIADMKEMLTTYKPFLKNEKSVLKCWGYDLKDLYMLD